MLSLAILSDLCHVINFLSKQGCLTINPAKGVSVSIQDLNYLLELGERGGRGREREREREHENTYKPKEHINILLLACIMDCIHVIKK